MLAFESLTMLTTRPWFTAPLKTVFRHTLNPLLGKPCPACGKASVLCRHRVLDPELVRTWRLSPEWIARFNMREGHTCLSCGCSLRVRQLAAVLVEEYTRSLGTGAPSLAELARAPAFRALRIAEINAVGLLHLFLKEHPNVKYSEYGSTNPAVPSEDLGALSYADEEFDLVLTSETLEHLPDPHAALREIRRVLKPGGRHVFTTPVVWDRPRTLRRAAFRDGRIEHLLEPSYHGAIGQRSADRLVFHEFGADVEELVRSAGFALRVRCDVRNPALTTFISVRD
jgi:SAM-dependent methyltransferase